MEILDTKINRLFAGKVVRKDLTTQLKGNAVVPSYVLEYLLGQYCATDQEESIQEGLQIVREILVRHFVQRDEAELVKSTIREKGVYKVIDKVEASLNIKKDCYEASFTNLGISQVLIDDDTVRKHKKLLTGGVWCIVDVAYFYTDDKTRSPWSIDRLKPIQISFVDIDEFKLLRDSFSTEEWLEVLMQSLGLNPELFHKRAKFLQLTRLVPFCENNYNLIELGPKGTGKSHIFSEFSPHGILISGGDVSQAKLFVNNANGKIGLVGFWDTIAFDEFAGKDKRVNKKLVDIMKNYMANKSFSRGKDVYGASASMAFVGNTDHSVPYMLKHSHLFESLPSGYLDSAFLDRIHCYLPGWEVNKLRNEMFSMGYGFIVDYLAEILKALRKEDWSHLYKSDFEISDSLTSRDRDGVSKTFSGLMKLIFPHGKFQQEEAGEILEFAMEGRLRVKRQLYKIDDTFEEVDFSFKNLATGKKNFVEALELINFNENLARKSEKDSLSVPMSLPISKEASEFTSSPNLSAKTITIRENQKGVSYESLFGDYLIGASEILIRDPYIRHKYQMNNLLDLLKVIIKIKPEGEEVKVRLFTACKYGEDQKSESMLFQIQENVALEDVIFSYELVDNEHFHARSIETNTGWKINLERGLDIFVPPDRENPFDLGWSSQEYRKSKGTTITYLRKEEEEVV